MGNLMFRIQSLLNRLEVRILELANALNILIFLNVKERCELPAVLGMGSYPAMYRDTADLLPPTIMSGATDCDLRVVNEFKWQVG